MKRTLLLVALLLVTPYASGFDATVQGIEASRAEGRITITFDVANVFTEELIEQLQSGIPIKFRHRIDAIAPKRFWLTTANVEARTIVETRVAYDALTERYELSRTTFHRKPDRKTSPPPLEERSFSDDFEVVRRWMTQCSDVVLFDPNKPLSPRVSKVRVESVIGRKYVLWVFPSRVSVQAEVMLEP